MSLGDTIGYLIFGNPLSQALISTASSVVQSTKKSAPQIQAPNPHVCLQPLWKLAGRDYFFVRLAGISGAVAVIMGAYGKHHLASLEPKDQLEAKAVFETASRFHFLNTFALLAMPLAKKPFVVSNVFL